MNSILYGNLRIEVLAGVGGRVDRLTFDQAAPRLSARPILPQEKTPALIFGRDLELEQVRTAFYGRRPIEFSAACGFGMSSLLRYVAATAAVDSGAGAGVYLQVGNDELEDLLTRLVDELHTTSQRVKVTPEQCAQVLGQAHGVIALDDVTLDPEQVHYLVMLLAGCSLVLASSRPILGRYGISQALSGLPDDAAMQLVANDLGRNLTSTEVEAIRRLADAVKGQPLHLRQAAALVRDDRMSFDALAERARHDPEILDRLSVNALAVQQRRALGVLALAAGALLPSELVGAMGDIAQVGECLSSLHRRGLAEQRNDRFGLPICKADSYQKMLLKDLNLAAALRELVDWFAARDPTAADTTSAASAALAIIGRVAEWGDWPAVVRLVKVVEPVLTLAGRWDASRHALALGLHAAKVTGNQIAEAFFLHEQGTLALCRDELVDAKHLLEHALDLRERAGDRDGAAVTRHNLQVLQPPSPPAPPPGRRTYQPRKIAVGVGGALALLLALVFGIIRVTAASHPQANPTTDVSRPETAPVTRGPGSSAPSGSTGGSGSSSESSPAQLRPPTLPGQTDFGFSDIAPGTLAVSRTVQLSNPNAQTLPIGQAGISGDPAYTVTEDNCSSVAISPHGSCTIRLNFAPTSLGAQQATLTVALPSGQPTTGGLVGTGFVKLTLTVDGNGTVSDGQNLICPPTCTEQITAPDDITLTESPTTPVSSGPRPDTFDSWGGDCSGKETTCTLSGQQLTTDKTVTAKFVSTVE